MGSMNNMMGGYGLLWMLVVLLLWGGLLALLAWGIVRFFSARRNEERVDTSGSAKPDGIKSRFLIAGLAAAALLTLGAGVSYAGSQMGSMMNGGDGTGGMMCGGRMGSMMGGGGMDGGMMGSFDEEESFDLQFIDQMTMHHEGANMSSEHMISDSERPELRELAENIQKSQSEQIDQMQEWRRQWYGDAGQTSGMPVGMMDEMMGDGMMNEMMGGDATDAMFLQMMIPHHQMAVDMSEEALEEAEHPELKELAQTIRDEQSAEIELMKGYLDEIEASTGEQEGSMMGGMMDADESHHE
ncbi:MAG: DUF305 domain-containing protein [Actinobacteria bacterium]|nr:DUF305 domain-containing protein [Actinomycetota bacterium]